LRELSKQTAPQVGKKKNEKKKIQNKMKMKNRGVGEGKRNKSPGKLSTSSIKEND